MTDKPVTTISRENALKQADEILLGLICSGDEKIFDVANGDVHKIARAGIQAREKLADKIQAGEI